MNGYASREYAQAMAEWGVPRHLPRCDGWLLERYVAQSGGWRDAMGPYPLFACRDWSHLRGDLDELGDLVSVTLVTEPFGGANVRELREAFDHVVEFKLHVIVEFGSDWTTNVSKHHRRDTRRALRALSVERVAYPPAHLDDWVELYSTLADRHGMTGLHRFSRASFAVQLKVPGIVMFIAREGDAIVGAGLWYVQGDVGYSHLQATSKRGYALGASYALYWTAFHELADQLAAADIGSGAGAGGSATGLDVFKRGWSVAAPAPVYLCGRTMDADRYAHLAERAARSATSYYPAYRAGEFA